MSQPYRYNAFFWSPWDESKSNDIYDLLNQLEGFDHAIHLDNSDDQIRFLEELTHPELLGFLLIDARNQNSIGELLFSKPEKILFKYEKMVSELSTCEQKYKDTQKKQNRPLKKNDMLADVIPLLESKEPEYILAWAELASRIEWQVIVVADGEPEFSSVCKDVLDSELQLRPPFGFHVVDPGNPDYPDKFKRLAGVLGVTAGTRKFGRSQIDSTDGRLIYSQGPMRPWGYYDLPSTEIILNQWIREEFENDKAVHEFNEMCEQLCRCTLESEESDCADFQQPKRVVLYALSLARRLATRSFEGQECETNLLLAPIDNIKKLNSEELFGQEFYSFRNPETPDNKNYEHSFFHAADGEFLEADIELAQSFRLCFLVDLGKGAVQSIQQLSTTQCDSPALTFKEFTAADVGANRFVLIRMCPYGYVEVYYNGRLSLWYDRSQWQALPFEWLAKRLWKYYEYLKSDEGRKKRLVRHIISAIGEVMNRRESSIIAFISPEDLGKLPITPMREGKVHRYQLGDVKIDDTKVSALALSAILHLDGAHIIEHETVRMFSQEIQVTENSADTASHGPGTGRRRARLLAESIASPGFVVKVSASGNLKIFDGSREEEPGGGYQ